MILGRAIDTDNYDGPVGVEVFADLLGNYDVKEAIVGCQVGQDGGTFTELQRDNARLAGMAVRFHYDFLYWDSSGSRDLDRMKRAAGFGLPVWMDEETEGGFLASPNWSANQVVDRIGKARDVLLAEGQWGGHYTNPGWWARFAGDTRAFAGDPLWLATWPYGNGVLPPLEYLPNFIPGTESTGGMLLMHQQYADTCYGGHTNFDLDCLSMANAPAPPEGPPYGVRFEHKEYLSDGSWYIQTGTYDPPPWAIPPR